MTVEFSDLEAFGLGKFQERWHRGQPKVHIEHHRAGFASDGTCREFKVVDVIQTGTPKKILVDDVNEAQLELDRRRHGEEDDAASKTWRPIVDDYNCHEEVCQRRRLSSAELKAVNEHCTTNSFKTCRYVYDDIDSERIKAIQIRIRRCSFDMIAGV